MALKQATRVVIAESGAPWLSLVAGPASTTLVLAQTPGEQGEHFGRRVSERLAALAGRNIMDIVIVTRPRAHERETAHAQGLLERLARAHHPALVAEPFPFAV